MAGNVLASSAVTGGADLGALVRGVGTVGEAGRKGDIPLAVNMPAHTGVLLERRIRRIRINCPRVTEVAVDIGCRIFQMLVMCRAEAEAVGALSGNTAGGGSAAVTPEAFVGRRVSAAPGRSYVLLGAAGKRTAAVTVAVEVAARLVVGNNTAESGAVDRGAACRGDRAIVCCVDIYPSRRGDGIKIDLGNAPNMLLRIGYITVTVGAFEGIRRCRGAAGMLGVVAGCAGGRDAGGILVVAGAALTGGGNGPRGVRAGAAVAGPGGMAVVVAGEPCSTRAELGGAGGVSGIRAAESLAREGAERPGRAAGPERIGAVVDLELYVQFVVD